MASGKDVLSPEEVVEIAERGDIDILVALEGQPLSWSRGG